MSDDKYVSSMLMEISTETSRHKQSLIAFGYILEKMSLEIESLRKKLDELTCLAKLEERRLIKERN